MAAIELVQQINTDARADLQKVSRKEGWLGAAEDQDYGVFFSRDAATDSIIAADLLEHSPNHQDKKTLKANMRRSLMTMARYQGAAINPSNDEEPGKVIHEERHDQNPKNQQRLEELKSAGWPVVGEKGHYSMRYYGSIDATPLALIALCDFTRVAKDTRLFNKLDMFTKSAILWMIRYGDSDGDGFIEYEAKNRNALLNQGWKDSGNSIQDENGFHPKEPIALVEVQGYQYEALTKCADLYEESNPELTQVLRDRAKYLKIKFNQDFWMEDERFFAYALDGEKRQIRDKTSNAGHLLKTGIVSEEKVGDLVDGLLAEDMFSKKGGIRTLSTDSSYFSDKEPEGYHNGSIWPMDNMNIIIGLRRLGLYEEAGRVIDALIEGQSALRRDYGVQNEELYIVTRGGKLKLYETSNKPQGWTVVTNLNISSAPPIAA